MFKWINRISIFQRLVGAFVLVAMIGAAIGTVGFISTERMNGRAQITYEQGLTGLKFTARAEAAVVYSGRAIEAAILAPDEKTRDEQLADARRFHVTDKGVVLVTADMLRKLAAGPG